MTTSPAPQPYGSWDSPITAADVARRGYGVQLGSFVDGPVWWSEILAAEGGRSAIRRHDGAGGLVDILPSPWNARTRVHEYGGGAWAVTSRSTLVFAEYTDQRLYRLDLGSDDPEPLTPEPSIASGLRYSIGTLVGDEAWCIRETHDVDGVITRDICAVPLDGRAATDPTAVRSVVSGSHFLAGPRLSADGRRLAWIAWNHPQMPWDGTELRVADLLDDGSCGAYRTLMGSTSESVLQPEWADDEHLYVASDRTGWWNLYRVDVAGRREPEPLCPRNEEFAGPLWQLGQNTYAVLADGRILAVHTLGGDRLGILDPVTGTLGDLDLGGLTTLQLGDADAGRALIRSGGPHHPDGLRTVDLATSIVSDVRLSTDQLPDPDYLPIPENMTFTGPGGRDVHAVVYPPHNAHAVAPDGERPPFVALVHGGPTAHVSAKLDLRIAYFTSRGIGIVDVNYGGSTGYGRAYRERLRGQWGVVDVEDTLAVLLGLADAGLADRNRLALQGGSAGGWTALAALTRSDVIACGVSYYGVSDLLLLAAHTHDFESRYLDGLVGPLPDAREVYEQRAPINRVEEASCPVLLLQGLDDPIVSPEQSEIFADAMARKGIPHAYLAFEGESHGFRRAETNIAALEAELSFYGQVMGFDPPGTPRLQLT
jgi:dipeptidyl aminopeptidase/acylaminoacyl peptidase